VRWQLRRAREPGQLVLRDGDLLIGPHPADSDFVGTFVVKPGRSLAWLTARHPRTAYFIRELA
jgi:hypothetical protein